MNATRLGLPRLKAPSAALAPWARQALRPAPALAGARSLSTTPTYYKRPRHAKGVPPPVPSFDAKDPAPTGNVQDPYNFDDVKERFGQLSETFAAELKQARQGGGANPSSIAALAVPTRDGTFPLRELAQVVPRSNRSISLLVNDESHVKPVMSAIQASESFNQQPQRDPENELELVMRVEVERPEEVKKRLKDVCHNWRYKVRDVRQRRERDITLWKKAKIVTIDESKLLQQTMMDMMKKELTVVDKAEAQAVAQVDKSRS